MLSRRPRRKTARATGFPIEDAPAGDTSRRSTQPGGAACVSRRMC
jgi:hypothetical protein